jgi:hypothetical protein
MTIFNKETAEDFLLRSSNLNGRIVNSDDLSDLQISEARKEFRFFVTEQGLGFAILPWELTTRKDRKREADYFSQNNMMV